MSTTTESKKVTRPRKPRDFIVFHERVADGGDIFLSTVGIFNALTAQAAARLAADKVSTGDDTNLPLVAVEASAYKPVVLKRVADWKVS